MGDGSAARISPRVWLAAAAAGTGLCWWWLWTQRGYWNPLVFAALWTCATVVLRTLSAQPPFPLRRQLMLMAVSAPLWWWFEFVNEFVQNWRYHGTERYSWVEYQVFATIAFSTVVPALDAAWTAASRWLPANRERTPGSASLTRASALWVIAAGCAAQAAVFLWPKSTYAFVWIAPFLLLDGVVSLRGGASLLQLMRQGAWRVPWAVALGGLACGFCWELWNYHAMPKWTYDVPLVSFWHLFEMPLLGYGGYIPFAWSVYQAVALTVGVTGLSGVHPPEATQQATSPAGDTLATA